MSPFESFQSGDALTTAKQAEKSSTAFSLSASGLIVERGERVILTGVSLNLSAGDALVVTGPNGAGKSTLLRTLAGLLPAASGTIELRGGDPEARLAEQVHLLGHSEGTKGSLTVLENLSFWTQALGGTVETLGDALKAVGLSHIADLPASVLSAGQRRRLAMARLVSVGRPIWLLDEPATALDTDGVARLGDLVRDHRKAGGIVIAATHTDLGWPKLKRMVLGRAV